MGMPNSASECSRLCFVSLLRLFFSLVSRFSILSWVV